MYIKSMYNKGFVRHKSLQSGIFFYKTLIYNVSLVFYRVYKVMGA